MGRSCFNRAIWFGHADGSCFWVLNRWFALSHVAAPAARHSFVQHGS